MKDLIAIKAVYCYMFKETWECLESIQNKLSRDFFLRTTSSEKIDNIFKDLFRPKLVFPSKKDGGLVGNLNLDELFIPVSKRIVDKYKRIVLGLEKFENIYPSAGSSDAIFKTISYIKNEGYKTLNVFEKEYEGFGIIAKTIGLEVVEHKFNKSVVGKKWDGVFYISNPSARDGNVLDENLLNDLLDSGNQVMFDLAYAGTTSKRVYNVDHKNVIGVLLSLSKPYGVFETRVTGFCFLKDSFFKKAKIDSYLYGNRWFTDKVRTLQSLKLVQDLGPTKTGEFVLYKKYKQIQKEIVAYLQKEYNLPFKMSDSFLLAYINEKDLKNISEEQLNIIKDYKRGNNYRFCLTPYFEMWENK